MHIQKQPQISQIPQKNQWNLWLFLRVNICAISETSLGFPGPASLYGKSQFQTLPRFGKVGLYTHGG
jgi:hypothetical protein